MINVTKTYLPKRERIDQLLDEIYESSHVTNHGPKVLNLENALKEYLKVDHLQLVTNGTIALQIAIKALGLKGEILTTPFSYVATLNSIIWESCTPVFIDIEETTGNVDVSLIEDAITPSTCAFLFTHVFGNPCDVEAIQDIAERKNLPVVYDAAHAFGVKIKNKSVLSCGAISTLSFHATKIFHTVEGGAIICNTDSLEEEIFLLKSFGHKAYDHTLCGINGKMSEVHAAFGLAMLPDMGKIISQRKAISNKYMEKLSGSGLDFLEWHSKASKNYAYFPVLLPDEKTLLKKIHDLHDHNIYPRRYFYPSLNTMPYINYQACPVSEDFSQRILCLPLYSQLEMEVVDDICNIILHT